MTYAQFAAKVGAYMRREPASFVVNGFDSLLDAVNAARRWAVREHEFSVLKRNAYVTVGADREVSLDNAVDVNNVALNVERALSLHLLVPGTRVFETPALTVKVFDEEALLPSSESVVYQEGRLLRNVAAEPGTVVGLKVLVRLADLTGSETVDLFLNDYHDWLLLRVVNHLNFFVREDARVQISVTYMQQEWRSVVMHDMRKQTGMRT